MKGVGIDLVEVARIQNSMENPRFFTRFFGVEERRPSLKANMRLSARRPIMPPKKRLAKLLESESALCAE